MDLSITIASYNGREVLRDALDSCRREAAPRFAEVIVFDNGSSDGSPEMVCEHYPEVRLIRSEDNLGFAAAHNRAMAASSGRAILILNSDAVLEPGSVGALLDALEEERVGAVGPQMLTRDGRPVPSSRRRAIYSKATLAASVVNVFWPYLRLLPVGLARRVAGRLLRRVHDHFDPPTEREEVEWVDGGCVLFSRAALEDVGLFDEQFFFDFEIGDLLARMRAGGWRVLYEPRARVRHHGGHARRRHPRVALASHYGHLAFYARHRPDYLGVLRRSALVAGGAKRAWLSLLCRRDEAALLGEILALYRAFDPAEVERRARVPRLSPERPMRREVR